MLKDSTSKLATWVALIACVLAAVLPAGGLALCLGHDGHVAVATLVSAPEPQDAGHACPCVPEDRAIAPSGDRHSPCDDLELRGPQLFHQKAGHDDGATGAADAGVALTPSVLDASPVPPADCGGPAIARACAEPPPLLAHLRTVRLLL